MHAEVFHFSYLLFASQYKENEMFKAVDMLSEMMQTIKQVDTFESHFKRSGNESSFIFFYFM